MTTAVASDSNAVQPITYLAAPQEQHLLMLFFPLQKGKLAEALGAVGGLTSSSASSTDDTTSNEVAAGGPDTRAATGVHFFLFYGLPADTEPTPALPVPSFSTAPGKDLLVVLSIYDADFTPYISAFTSQPAIAYGLNAILSLMDESGIVPDTDHTSAKFILSNGGVAQNNLAFVDLLMRYNFADPTIPGAAKLPVSGLSHPKYVLGATFPGLTIGSILQNYPNATALWPSTPVDITFAQSAKPDA